MDRPLFARPILDARKLANWLGKIQNGANFLTSQRIRNQNIIPLLKSFLGTYFERYLDFRYQSNPTVHSTGGQEKDVFSKTLGH